MLASFSSIERQRDAGAAPRDSQILPGAIDQQILEAERALERMKRDLVVAQARAQQQEQKLAEARRRMEQWRWVNAVNEGDPETVRLAAASLAVQTHVVDDAVKSNAAVSAHVERLQNRVERQSAFYFDLQSRRRANGNSGRREDHALQAKAPAANRQWAQESQPGATDKMAKGA